jgi:hypothetical protein
MKKEELLTLQCKSAIRPHAAAHLPQGPKDILAAQKKQFESE